MYIYVYLDVHVQKQIENAKSKYMYACMYVYLEAHWTQQLRLVGLVTIPVVSSTELM